MGYLNMNNSFISANKWNNNNHFYWDSNQCEKFDRDKRAVWCRNTLIRCKKTKTNKTKCDCETQNEKKIDNLKQKQKQTKSRKVKGKKVLSLQYIQIEFFFLFEKKFFAPFFLCLSVSFFRIFFFISHALC